MSDPPNADDLADVHRLLPQAGTRWLRWRGSPAFAKRAAPLRAHERLLQAASPLLRRWLAPGLPFVPVRRPAAPTLEAQRLAELARAGIAVPPLLAADAELLVIAAAGESLADALKREPDRTRREAQLCEAADALAALHAAGQWHGGAQLRNVLRAPDGGLVRIDFETPLDARLPLPALQAFDALLFASSLPEVGDEAAVAAACGRYVAAAPQPALAVLRRHRGRLCWLANSRFIARVAPTEAPRYRALQALAERL